VTCKDPVVMSCEQNKKRWHPFFERTLRYDQYTSKLLTLVDGDVDGAMVGLLEGDRVGWKDRCDKREEKRHIMCC